MPANAALGVAEIASDESAFNDRSLYCEPAKARIAFRTAAGSLSHAAITACRSASSDDGK